MLKVNDTSLPVDLSLVSVVIPCLNEEAFIGKCLDSVIKNDFPKDKLEVLIIDGMSTDGTRMILADYTCKYPFIKLLDNPKKITPSALNLGITNARGEIIIRIDSHAMLQKNYISRCVESLERYRADNVGGIMKTLPQQAGLIGEAIILSLSHRFGVGNSYFRVHTDEPRWVDTVFGGCYRREVFDQVGMFNEDLARGQDLEFNLRLKKLGGRTLLVPDIVSYYYARSDIRSFWNHNLNNGVWAIIPFLHSPVMPVSWRHLVPLVFVTSLLGSAMLSFFFTGFLWILFSIVISYSVLALFFSTQIAIREKQAKYLFIMPAIFAMLHISYGLGSLWALLRVSVSKKFWRQLKVILTEG